MTRLLIVVVVALAGFAAAFVAFGDAARRNCVLDGSEDPRYAAVVEEPVAAGSEGLVVRVTRGGEPLAGAWVCANLAPAGTPGHGVGAEGRALEPGRYAVPLELPTAGRWTGRVLVGEDGADPEVAVPVTVEVVAGDLSDSSER